MIIFWILIGYILYPLIRSLVDIIRNSKAAYSSYKKDQEHNKEERS